MRRTAMRFRLRRRCTVVVVALAALVANAMMAAAETPTVSQPAAVAPPAKAPSATEQQPGMRAAIEPETGQLGTPASVDAAPSAPSQPGPAPVFVRLSDGSMMVDLKGTLIDYTVIRLDANGQKVLSCVQDPKAASQTPPPAPKREEQ